MRKSSTVRERLQRRMGERESIRKPVVIPAPDPPDAVSPPIPPRVDQTKPVPCAAGMIEILKRLMQRLSVDRAQSLELTIPLDEKIEPERLVALEQKCDRKMARILGHLRSFGATFWDAECYLLLLEASDPSIFAEAVTHQVLVSPHGWITSVRLRRADGSRAPRLNGLGRILASYFNHAIMDALRIEMPTEPTTERVSYIETFLQSNRTPDEFEEMVRYVCARVGIVITEEEKAMLQRRVALCQSVPQLHEQFSLITRQLLDFTQSRCSLRVIRNVSQIGRIRCIVETLNTLCPTIYAAIFYNVFGLSKPVWFRHSFDSGRIRMVGQYYSPVFWLSRYEGQEPCSSHRHLEATFSSENELVCVTYGLDPIARTAHQFAAPGFCQESVRRANALLRQSIHVIDYAKDMITIAF